METTKFLGLIPFSAMPRQVASLLKKYERFIVYALIGGGAVVIDVGLFALFTSGPGISIIAANTLSIFIAMLYSFGLNARFNFKVSDSLLARFISFVIVTGIGYFVSTLMLHVFSNMLGIHAMLIKTASLPVVLVVQYLLNSRFTFSNKSNVR